MPKSLSSYHPRRQYQQHRGTSSNNKLMREIWFIFRVLIKFKIHQQWLKNHIPSPKLLIIFCPLFIRDEDSITANCNGIWRGGKNEK
jgi:hypothetical protein